MQTSEELERKAMADAIAAGVTVEDLARGWASIDGKRDAFDAGKVGPDETGHYQGYCIEAREVIERATRYALERKS